MSGVGGSILEVVVSVCGFVVNGSGYSVVGNRNTKIQEWYRGLFIYPRLTQSATQRLHLFNNSVDATTISIVITWHVALIYGS